MTKNISCYADYQIKWQKDILRLMHVIRDVSHRFKNEKRPGLLKEKRPGLLITQDHHRSVSAAPLFDLPNAALSHTTQPILPG